MVSSKKALRAVPMFGAARFAFGEVGLAEVSAGAGAGASASASANTGVLHFVQDDGPFLETAGCLGMGTG